METLLENLVNGNLSTAKKQARRFSSSKIVSYLEDSGQNSEKAALTALYLKGGLDWQDYCDRTAKL